ncbi:hypothetical protein EJ06DRAFT_329314 [Trichodelitschia bisporula]|uniref:Uncharacterized protein n=1 Tax=Trichodelitschia bisporula TaxID=703511 RepID=A0A6G1I2K1_9PEZI|nr:hypothetical protein EJ06DRAFT_329314 [Trichodelitschia bisporula]
MGTSRKFWPLQGMLFITDGSGAQSTLSASSRTQGGGTSWTSSGRWSRTSVARRTACSSLLRSADGLRPFSGTGQSATWNTPRIYGIPFACSSCASIYPTTLHEPSRRDTSIQIAALPSFSHFIVRLRTLSIFEYGSVGKNNRVCASIGDVSGGGTRCFRDPWTTNLRASNRRAHLTSTPNTTIQLSPKACVAHNECYLS